MKPITIIAICVICAATLMSGCVEPSLSATYGSAMLDDSDVRESDGFELKYKILDDDYYWEVITLSTYPAFNDMRDDERHSITMRIKHMYSVRQSHDKMMDLCARTDASTRPPNTFTELLYGDMSYMVTYVRDIDYVYNKGVSIHIQKDKMVGELTVAGYSDMEECQEVADHYAPILERMLNACAQEEII